MCDNNENKSVGFIGLTHMGIVTGACWAHKHSPVIGFDSDKNLIEQLNNGKIPISEPKLNDLIKNNSNRIKYTSDFSLLSKCESLSA